MAYFPNGSAGADFAESECEGCVHFKLHIVDGRPWCPLTDAHLLFNSDQIVDGKREGPLFEVLKMLIDDDKPLGEMCQMRIEDETAPDPNQMDLLGRG